MVYSLTYRRPAHVSSSASSIHSEKSANAESITSRSSCTYGIPDALSFDRIIEGGTCPVSHGCCEQEEHGTSEHETHVLHGPADIVTGMLTYPNSLAPLGSS